MQRSSCSGSRRGQAGSRRGRRSAAAWRPCHTCAASWWLRTLTLWTPCAGCRSCMWCVAPGLQALCVAELQWAHVHCVLVRVNRRPPSADAREHLAAVVPSCPRRAHAACHVRFTMLRVHHRVPSARLILQTRIAKEVACRRKMSPDAWRLFSDNHVSEVVIPNCTQISEADMAQGLQTCCSGPCAPAFVPSCAAQHARSRSLWTPSAQLCLAIFKLFTLFECAACC